MKLYCIFDDIIFWLQTNGGASRYWFEICSRSASQEHLLVSSLRRNDLTDNPWRYNVDASHYLARDFLPLSISRYLDCTVTEGLNIESLSNIVFHSSHYRVPSNKSIANVVTVHDFTYELYRSGLAKAVHVWQKKRAIEYADLVICISEFTKAQLLKIYPQFSKKRIEVVYHGVGDEFFFDINSKSNSKSKSKVTNQIIFLGSRIGYKRFDLAVEATLLTSTKILTIVGGKLTTEEVEFLNSKIQNRWCYAGRLSDPELNDLYNSSFCLLYPSDSEGFGLPLLEAMKAGCPVVCSNLTAFPEVAGNAALFAVNQTGSAYAEQILKLDDIAVRTETIAKGFVRSSSFTWEKCHRNTLDSYQLALTLRNERCKK